jgi:hypothetical protein
MTNHESNDEARMTNDEGNPNDEVRREVTDISNLSVIRASSLIRHSSFDIRHFSLPLTQD